KLTKVEADLSAAIDERRRALCAGNDDQPLPSVVDLMGLRDGVIDALAQIDAEVAEVEQRAATERDYLARLQLSLWRAEFQQRSPSLSGSLLCEKRTLRL